MPFASLRVAVAVVVDVPSAAIVAGARVRLIDVGSPGTWVNGALSVASPAVTPTVVAPAVVDDVMMAV